ncbi:MAG: cytochrome c [Nitratireductor sp.]|nr:cytochrome c [Nitratireductor sp.]
MKKTAAALVILAIAAAAVFWLLTMPSRLPADAVAAMDTGDPARGERMFWAGGCSSCHAAKGAEGEALKQLGGGLALATPFGTFHAPNISPDPATGIGRWTGEDFANAMMKGVSPDGAHYYPAFPYTSYARMQMADVADLWAYMKTLPPVAQENLAHELPLPFRLRRGLGLWKHLFLSNEPVVALASQDEKLALGRYLVEGPGHCGECHTPRNLIGGPDKARWLGGGPAPEGKGNIPNITPAGRNISGWSEGDIASYLETGFTPEYDAVGGSMVDVQENMARLRPEDRAAIAAYLKAVPPVQ